jgi:hypothetical protein
MKKLATAIATVALIGAPAFAADMAVKAPPPPSEGLLGTMAKANGGGASAPAYVIFFIVYLSRRSSRWTWRPRHLLRRCNLEAQVHR